MSPRALDLNEKAFDFRYLTSSFIILMTMLALDGLIMVYYFFTATALTLSYREWGFDLILSRMGLTYLLSSMFMQLLFTIYFYLPLKIF